METNGKICEKFRLKKENQKIIVYIFNHKYFEYLKKLPFFESHSKIFLDSHSKKFLESNEFPHEKSLCDLYTKIYEEEKRYNPEKLYLVEKPDLIKTIVFSKKPYIFFFIQDLFNLFIQMKNEIQEKENQLKEELKEKNQKNDEEKNKVTNKENQIINEEKKEENKLEKSLDMMTKDIKEMKNLLKLIILVFLLFFLTLIISNFLNLKKKNNY